MAEPLWRWTELCAALDLAIEDGPDISGISIDSRQIAAGDLFIALTGDPGTRFNPSQRSDRDGHDFIDAALENGAAGVLSHDALKRACPELKVADSLDALWALGAAARSRLDCPVVAITGSSGKTTTKSLLSAALDAFSTPGSLNNHLGVPISLARTPRDASAAVYEIGTNHPGEIAPLS
ncbi:MAG: Mur ligase family protein, partial [Pseudomonadales bacterium]